MTHNSDAAVDPVLHREFLEELQKVMQIPICERQRLPRIFVNSGTLKLIGDLNTIINLLKDEPDMSEISYLVYSAASLVSKRRGLKTTKSTNSQTPTWNKGWIWIFSHFDVRSHCCWRLERVHRAFVCYMNFDFSGISWAFPFRKVVRSSSMVENGT